MQEIKESKQKRKMNAGDQRKKERKKERNGKC